MYLELCEAPGWGWITEKVRGLHGVEDPVFAFERFRERAKMPRDDNIPPWDLVLLISYN